LGREVGGIINRVTAILGREGTESLRGDFFNGSEAWVTFGETIQCVSILKCADWCYFNRKKKKKTQQQRGEEY